jgi:hypothetical protein
LLSKKGAAVGECMLNNSIGFAVGLVGGVFVSLQRKNPRPFIVAITAGTAADMLFGYCYSCRGLINEYEAMKLQFSADGKGEAVTVAKK